MYKHHVLIIKYVQVYKNIPLSGFSMLYIQVQQPYLVLSNLGILSTFLFSSSYPMTLKKLIFKIFINDL